MTPAAISRDTSGASTEASFDAALFDLDGLLIDSERPIRDAWLRAAAARGLPLDADAYQSVIGTPEGETRRLLSRVLGSDEAYVGVRADADRLLADLVFAPKPGALALLAKLHARGVARAVVSSTVAREVRRRLDAAGLGRYVESLTGGDEVAAGRGKPNPDLYWLAAERIGVRPSRCIVFEDSEPGAKAALAAGMGLIIVPDLRRPGDAVRSAALGELESLEQAVERCGTWFGWTGN